ncbi:MAG: serine/threonine protein kinase [Phycisphaerales bacterium]|nr:serine/threonine protein kinase [Phycisphaerales bacterium]
MSDPTPNPSPLIRAKQVFLAVCDMPLPQRNDEIARLCAGDARLRGMVEGLLAGDAAPLPFESLAEDIVAARGGLEPDGGGDGDSQRGSRIGPYRVVEKIGEGGFGVVYMAEQDEPIRRRVALKIIKLGMDTRRVVARFEQERQALALMDHPNIAKVHDAGATPAGRPYFAMELCPGRSITDYCDYSRLTVDQRLGLFVQVCRAVEHAHQKGLIHRDIKPSNILVSTVDDKPLVKVIDFGIAKAVQARLTEKTLFTENRQLIGTPEYMSPEQAEGSLDIDTRTDVYSLGVLLYELLTGSTPFSGRDLRSAAFAEIQRIIKEVEPPRPSTRLSLDSDTIAGIAANRRTEPRRLGTAVRGELDWIAMRALEKDRQRRYASAADLAADIGRYLADEPVVARPATTLYRWRKFARRNRVLVTSAAAVLVWLGAGLAATTAMYIKADRARAAETAQRARAQTKAATTQAINDFLTQDMLAAPNPWEGGGRKVTVADVLDKAAARVRSRFDGKPEVEASVRATLGESYRSLGLFGEAQPQYDRAVELRGVSGEPDQADLADALRMKAANMQALGHSKEAEPVCRDALARNTRLFGADSAPVADTLECLADIQIGLSLYADAEESLREALRVRGGLVAGGSAPPGRDLAVARLTSALGSSLHYQGRFDEAEREKLKSLELFGATAGPGGGEGTAYTAQVLTDLGALYFETERFDESEKCYNRALPIMTELLGPDHLAVIIGRRSLANTVSFLGKNEQAESMLKEAIAAGERTVGASHPETLASVNSLATLYLRTKRYAQAEPLLASLYERSSKDFGENHAETLKYAANLAWGERHLGRMADAERHFRLAVEGFEATLGPNHPNTIGTLDGLAQLLAADKRWREAAACDKQVLDRSAAAGLPEDTDTARILSRMGANLVRAGDFAAAREPLTRSLNLCRKGFGDVDWRTGTAEGRLGDCLSNLGLNDEAEKLLLAGVQNVRQDTAAPSGTLESGLKRLLAHFERTAQADKAARVREELPPEAPPTK